MERAPFPEIIDNTFRETFTLCHQKFFWQALRRQVADVPNIHLHAGGAFARGVEIARRSFYEQSLTATNSVAAGHQALIDFYGNFDEENGYLDHAKSLANMLRAFEDYFFEYQLDKDEITPMETGTSSQRGIEFSFALPLAVNHPTTGNPILYAGRFDMLGRRGDSLWVVDEKTSGQLGAHWSEQWDLNSQFTGYCYAAGHYGFPVNGAIIRGVGLLKTKITHQQVIIYRPEWMIQRWMTQLLRDVKKMIELWELDAGDGREFDYALGGACTSYGNCAYKRLCQSPNPEEWVAVGFKTSDWSPLHREEV